MPKSARARTCICPLRLFNSATSVPWNSCGAAASTLIIGSRMLGRAALKPWANACVAAILNANSDESTECAYNTHMHQAIHEGTSQHEAMVIRHNIKP